MWNVNNTRKHNVQKVESLSSKRIKLIFTINTTVSINAMYTMHINPTPKGIYTKLSVLHQYIRQMGPTCVKSYEQNVPHKVSPTHKLPPETLLQKYSLQPCTSPQTYLLWFGHLWIKSKRTDWPPLQTGLSETGNFTCHWESTATKERRLTFLQA